MPKKKDVKLYDYDPLDFLDTEEKLIDYLNAELKEGDIFYIKRALLTIARAVKTKNILSKVEISQEVLGQVLATDDTLEYATLKNLLDILDMHLIAVPNNPSLENNIRN